MISALVYKHQEILYIQLVQFFCRNTRAYFFVVNLDCAGLNKTYLVLETLTDSLFAINHWSTS